MVSVEELKKIFLMEKLTEPMLTKLAREAELRVHEERDFIIREGQPAREFMMLRSGKLVLKVEASESLTISLGAIKPGFSLGWSALIQGRNYTSSAVCTEKSEVFAVQGEALQGMMEEDHQMGYLMFQGVTGILENRLERRTRQFLKTLTRHINLESIL